MLNRLSRAIFFTGLFFLPLISFPNLENGFEGPKIIFFQRWVEILWLLVVLNWSRKKIKFQHQNSFIVLLLVSYFLWNLFTSLNGANPNISVYGLFWRGQGLIMLAHYLAFALLIPTLLIKSDIKKVALTLLLSGIAASLYLYSTLIAKHFFDQPIYLYLNRPVGTFGNPDFLAGFLAILLPLILYWKQKLSRIFIFAVIFGAILLAASRGTFLSLLIVSLVIIVVKLQAKLPRIAVAVTTILIAVFIWQLMTWIPIPLNSPTWAASRQRIWSRGALAVSKRPITGYGLENYQLAVKNINFPYKLDVVGEVSVDKAHNEILEILIASGGVGLVLWLGIVILAGRNLLIQKKYILFSCLLIFLLKSQTNVVSTPEYVLFWLLIGLSLPPSGG